MKKEQKKKKVALVKREIRKIREEMKAKDFMWLQSLLRD